MTKGKLLALFLAIFCILTGFSLPFLMAAGQDMHSAQTHWPFSDEAAHYAYRGTLLNRALALNAFFNGSPAVQEADRTSASPPESLWADLAAFLPLSGETASHAESFLLTPRQYSAEYRYTEVRYFGANLTLVAIIDSESRLPLRIELTADHLTLHPDARSLWDTLQGYAALLGLGELTDDVIIHNSALLQSQRAEIRGAPLTLTATAMPSAGTLLLKLTGSAAD